jgi:hypothetical protein
MKTKGDNKGRKENFETMKVSEMRIILGGGKKYKTEVAKEKDVFDPDEH